MNDSGCGSCGVAGCRWLLIAPGTTCQPVSTSVNRALIRTMSIGELTPESGSVPELWGSAPVYLVLADLRFSPVQLMSKYIDDIQELMRQGGIRNTKKGMSHASSSVSGMARNLNLNARTGGFSPIGTTPVSLFSQRAAWFFKLPSIADMNPSLIRRSLEQESLRI